MAAPITPAPITRTSNTGNSLTFIRWNNAVVDVWIGRYIITQSPQCVEGSIFIGVAVGTARSEIELGTTYLVINSLCLTLFLCQPCTGDFRHAVNGRNGRG